MPPPTSMVWREFKRALGITGIKANNGAAKVFHILKP
jgi:hypothetical protein